MNTLSKEVLGVRDLPCPVQVTVGYEDQVLPNVAQIDTKSGSVEVYLTDINGKTIIAPSGDDVIKVWVTTNNIKVTKDGKLLVHV